MRVLCSYLGQLHCAVIKGLSPSWLIRPEDLDLLPRHPDLITIFIIILIPISHMHGCSTAPSCTPGRYYTDVYRRTDVYKDVSKKNELLTG